MRWKIWHRQYGKTYELLAWWLRNPAERILICGNENLCALRRDELRRRLANECPAGIYNTFSKDIDKLLRTHIITVGTWRTMRFTSKPDPKWEIALDDAEVTIGQLIGGNVVTVAGAGDNDLPDPKVKAEADAHHSKWESICPTIRV